MSEERVSLGYVPRGWQRECHLHKERFQVIVLHRRGGKTELAIVKLIDEALRSPHEMSLYVYMAPLLKQAKGIAWERLKHYARKIPGVEPNESELWVRLPNNAKIQLYGGDNPDGLRGLRLDGVVIDEVAQIKPEVWNEIVQPALSDRKGWALFIGTPKGVNLFSELFYKAQTLGDWHSARYTVYDTDALDPDEVERLRRDMPENEFNREYLCDFSASAENQLISISAAEDAARRMYKPKDYDWAPRILGVDVARFGDDRSVVVPRQGLVMHKPRIFSGLDNMAFAAQVVSFVQSFKPDAVFIDVGNGTGVIDRLRQLRYDVVEVNFGGKADSPRYYNKRSEMAWRAAEWIHAGGAIPNDPVFKMELATPTFDHDNQNRKRLESKDEIKKRLLKSPDIFDAFILTFAYPVAVPERTELERIFTKNTPTESIHEYNPLEGM